MPRYTFTTTDLQAWTAPSPSSSAPTTSHRPLTTVPWYWAAIAFALGGLAGVLFILTLLFILTV